ncbi:transcriptional regulator [Streptomyces sp. 3MP-14]|uniref:Transcriptional regulator n=2 Tax=Streptomyces TaxID=1883 RepID=A0A5N6AQ01_9ACTN|nr:transcriptional regulator [Streptomyces mimosae]KAB8178738.1 transcriptional regulator [Streptomyces sp. 3MP-14]
MGRGPSGASEFSQPEDDQPTNPLRRYGEKVRRVRLGRNLTQRHLATATGYSVGYVSMVEGGKLLPSQKFAQGCDLAFGTNGLFVDELRSIDEGDHPSWFLPYLDLEGKASRILNFSATLVTGLLQTENYARAVYSAALHRDEEAFIDGKTAARLSRQAIFERPAPPDLWVILHEACLRTVVGGADVMVEQLARLAAAASSPRIDIQVLPFSAGAAAPYLMPYTVLMFDNRPSVLYSDDPRGGRLYDSARTVAWGRDNYDRLRANALPLDASLALITSLSKEPQS